MKILILANFDVGLYQFRKELLEELIKRNYEVYISVPNGDLIDRIEAIGCRVIPTDIDRRGTNPIKDLALIKLYKKLINEINPSVVLTYTIKPNIYGGIAARSCKVPQVANVTGLGTAIENGGLSSKLILWLYKLGLKKTKRVFFQNSSNLELFKKLNIVSENSDLIPGSGVNLDKHKFEPYPDKEQDIVFLTVGRIMKNKGTDELLEAARIIKSRHKNVIFRLVGPFDEDYEQKVNDAVKDGIVEFCGSQTDVHPFNKDCSAALLPSYHEGMANVLLEGASTGRPVIATDVPGCRETYDPYVSGIPFKAKSADDMVRAIEEFLAMSYEERKAMGIAGRKKVEEQFDRQIVINKYLETIEKEVR